MLDAVDNGTLYCRFSAC